MLTKFNLEDFIAQHVTGRSESLLTRDLANNHDLLEERIDGKSALVIGGAGTIGSSFIRALLHFRPRRLYVVDTNENGLTELVRELRSAGIYHIPTEFITYPINLGDPVFAKLIRQEGPFEIVANFAAHKHVRSEKDAYSIEAMIDNNVLKAKRLLDLLSENPPERFFCVSTDKAANPVNIMGASKKLMEEVILAYTARFRVATARFANVAFSNGSLPLGFLDRTMRQQPWSCPRGIRRFFVSPQESGQICLMSCILGESGDIFFPKLDENRDMIPFDQIAIALCEALGYKPHICKSEDEARKVAAKLTPRSRKYPIYFFDSDTSGEKNFEEFYTDRETLDLDRFEMLGVIKDAKRANFEQIDTLFADLKQVFEKPRIEKADIVHVLRHYLPNFEHIEKGKHLDQRM